MNGIYKKNIDNLITFLLSTLPIALAAGPATIETIVFIIILLFFTSQKSIKFGKSDILIITLYLYLVLSSILSDFKIESLSSSFFLVRFVLLYFIFKYYFFTQFKYKIINLTFITLIITFIILVVDGYSQYFFNLNISSSEFTNLNRMTMHFRKDEYVMGSYLSKMLPIFLGLWYIKFKSLNLNLNFFLMIITILTLYCVVLSNERSASYLVVGFIFGLIILIKNKVYHKLVALSLICIIISLTILLVPSIKKRYVTESLMEVFGGNDSMITKDVKILRDDDKFGNFLNFNINNKNIYIFSTAHEAHIKTALNMFLHNPLVGIGPNNFRKLCLEKDYGIYENRGCTTHPHHIMFQILAETGIFGFVFYFLVIVFLTCKLFKQLFIPHIKFNLLCMYLFYCLLFLPILPSGNIFNNWYIYSIVMPLFYLKFSE